jgi:heat shock protein HslJ
MTKFTQSAYAVAAALALLTCTSMEVKSAEGKSAASTWILQQGADISLSKARPPKMRMDGKELTGSTGCNNFSATANDRPNNRVAIEQIVRTRMLCESNQNRIETALVHALEKTEMIREQGQTLTFLSGDGSTLLLWKRSTDSPSVKKSSTRRKNHARRHARAHRSRSHASRRCS